MSQQDSALDELSGIMRRLRDPEHGCPWDIRQTFASIAPYTVEEAYEVADAIERGDMVDLEDELGDLLLQVVYHAQMAEEQSLFALDDVIRGIADKMRRRHPHVFGPNAGQMAEADIKMAWERIKREERSARQAAKIAAGGTQVSDREANRSPSALDGVAANLPGLSHAEKLQTRAARVGFDWPDATPVWRCLQDEISELAEAVAVQDEYGVAEASASEAVVEELGDVLFTVVNLARHLKVEPETAMRQASRKFERRFRQVEQLADLAGTDLTRADIAELDALWVKAKESER